MFAEVKVRLNTVPNLRHGGGGIMIRVCFVASGRWGTAEDGRYYKNGRYYKI